MKKVVAMVLSVIMLLSMTSALAAGKVSVVQENFYALKNYYDYGYVFAKVANVGNKPIKINAGILEVYDAEGDNLTSTDSLKKYAEYLDSDEYTYVYMAAKLEEGQLEHVDDYLLTITGKSDTKGPTRRVTVKDVDFKRDYKVNEYYTYDCAFFTVVNETDETIWNIKIVYALLDDDDNILFVGSDSVDSNQGLTPGSSMRFRENIDDQFVKYYDDHGIIPTKVDAIAYIGD